MRPDEVSHAAEVYGYHGLIYATHFGKVYASDFGSNRASVST
ncbi:hypothetical protein [Fulvivirga maritima]|nr:hypothetical protein [Fulvivirga maritima]